MKSKPKGKGKGKPCVVQLNLLLLPLLGLASLVAVGYWEGKTDTVKDSVTAVYEKMA